MLLSLRKFGPTKKCEIEKTRSDKWKKKIAEKSNYERKEKKTQEDDAVSRGRGSVVEERIRSLVEALDRAEEIMNNRETGSE